MRVHPDVARFFRQVEGELAIPKELLPYIFDFTEHGPYAKYRWRENKRTYTISLGLERGRPRIRVKFVTVQKGSKKLGVPDDQS